MWIVPLHYISFSIDPGNNSGFSESIENPRNIKKSIDFEENVKNMTFWTRGSRYLNFVEQYCFKYTVILIFMLNSGFPLIKSIYCINTVAAFSWMSKLGTHRQRSTVIKSGFPWFHILQTFSKPLFEREPLWNFWDPAID